VKAETQDSIVTLTGHVRTWAGHDAVVSAAWMANVVISVRGELHVTAWPAEPVTPPGKDAGRRVPAGCAVMISSSHQSAELFDHSCNQSSVMIMIVSSAGPPG
jgi:hypothetical protein